MHSSTLYISVTTEGLDSKFHLTSQINSEIFENTTVSIDFDIESSDEIQKFLVVMDTVSAPEMSIKTDPVSSPCLILRNKKGILGPYKSLPSDSDLTVYRTNTFLRLKPLISQQYPAVSSSIIYIVYFLGTANNVFLENTISTEHT